MNFCLTGIGTRRPLHQQDGAVQFQENHCSAPWFTFGAFVFLSLLYSAITISHALIFLKFMISPILFTSQSDFSLVNGQNRGKITLNRGKIVMIYE